MDVKSTALILSIVFLSLAVLGSFGAHEAITHSVSCVGSLAQQSTCPETTGFAFISFHLDGLRSFSTGVSVAALVLAFALAFALVLASIVIEDRFQVLELSRIEAEPAPSLRRFRSWLSLFEKRDPLSA